MTPAEAFASLPEEYQQLMRRCVTEALIAELDRCLAVIAADYYAAKEAESQSHTASEKAAEVAA